MREYKAYSGDMCYGTVRAENGLDALRDAKAQEQNVTHVQEVLPQSSNDVIADYLTKAAMRVVWAARSIEKTFTKENKVFGEDDKTRVDDAIDNLEFAKSQLISLRKHVSAMQRVEPPKPYADPASEYGATGFDSDGRAEG